MNKSVCFFLHYSPEEFIPLYVQYYLNEVSRHFDEVRMMTNNRILQTQPAGLNNNIRIMFIENEGYDFGMFYKGFKALNPSEYSRIGCVNDSNLLLNKLDFLFDRDENRNVDFWGMVDSHEAPWFSKHENNYHIQSHFIVFNKEAIQLLPEFFKQVEAEKIFRERDKKQLRRKVINDWEIGISQFLLKKELSCAAYFNSRELLQKYNSRGRNITHVIYKELLEEGYPLLKKKVVLEKSLRLFSKKAKFKKLIHRYGNPEWNLEKALDEIFR